MKLPDYKKQKWIIVSVILIAFGLSLWNEYSMDDNNVTTQNNKSVSKGLSGIKDILTSPYSAAFDDTDQFEYRPVTPITFAVEKEIFGFAPHISHLINLLIYIALVLLVFKILRILLNSYPSWIPFLITLIFAAHPLHTEVVNSLKNREELLVALLGFGAMFWSIRFADEKHWKYFFIVLLLLAIGINTKASLTPFIMAIPVALALFGKTSWSKAGILFLVFFLTCAIALKLPRAFIEIDLSRATVYFENPLFDMTLAQRLPMGFYSFLIYLKLHILPYPLLSYYGYSHIDILNWNNYQVYMGMLLLIIICISIFYFFKRDKLICGGLTLFLIFLSPYQNFPFPVTGIIAERFAFNSVLGYSMLIAGLINHVMLTDKNKKIVKQRSKYFTGGIALLIIIFLFININRTREWKNFYSLMKADAETAKESVKLQIMYGDIIQLELAQLSDPSVRSIYIKNAITAYQRAIDVYPNYGGTYSNLGVVYTLEGNYKMAIKNLEHAISLGEDRAEMYYNLGASYELMGDTSKALISYQKSTERKNDYQPAIERIKWLSRSAK